MNERERTVPILVRRNALNTAESMLYDEVLRHVRALEDDIVVEVPRGSIQENRVPDIYYGVLYDHPEVFWLKTSLSYSVRSALDIDKVHLALKWGIPKNKYEFARRKAYGEARKFSAELPEGASAYVRAEMAYRYVNRLAKYKSRATQDQTILGVILGHEAVCSGFAKTYQFLLTQVGVPCGCVRGTITDGGMHLYDIIRVEGTYAYVDPTWASPCCSEDPNTYGASRQLTYRYFCLTTSEIARTHTPIKGQWLPKADSHALDWYLRNGLLFSKLDIGGFDRVICAAIERGAHSVEVKFKNSTSLDAAVSFVSSGRVWSMEFPNLIGRMGCKWSYVVNDRVRTLLVSWSMQ